MSELTRRRTDRAGVSRDVADATDSAYAAHTFVVPSRLGMTLPSDAFVSRGCITKDEWERRHAATYGEEV